MTIPNANRAIIAIEKLRDYLLNPDHGRGSSKARFLLAMGYHGPNYRQLEIDLREQHLARDCDRTTQTTYGWQYEIRAPIKTPIARTIWVRSIWQIDFGTEIPRFITLYPD